MSLTEFATWAKKFNKEYAPSITLTANAVQSQMVQKKYATWLANKKEIDRINNMPNPPYVAGLTNLSDFTESELNRLSGLIPPPGGKPLNEKTLKLTGNAVDWRTKKSLENIDVLTPMKSQEMCGTCFAYASSEQVESAFALAGGDPEELSSQWLANCTQGCDGGWMGSCMSLAAERQGLPTEADRPITCKGGSFGCNPEACDNAPIFHTGPLSQPQIFNGKQELVDRLQHGPIVAGIQAVGNLPGGYKSGIIDGPCNQEDHAIQIVGYQPRVGNTPAYFIFRNSWGAGWGMGGYGNINAEENSICLGDTLLDQWSAEKTLQCENNQCVPCTSSVGSKCLTPEQCTTNCLHAPPSNIKRWHCNQNNWTCTDDCTGAGCSENKAECDLLCNAPPPPPPPPQWQCHPSKGACAEDCLSGGNCHSTEQACTNAGCAKPTPTNSGWGCNKTQGQCFQGCVASTPGCYDEATDCNSKCKLSPAPSSSGGIPISVIVIVVVVVVIVAVVAVVVLSSAGSAAVAAIAGGGQKGWFKNLTNNLI